MEICNSNKQERMKHTADCESTTQALPNMYAKEVLKICILSQENKSSKDLPK